MIPYVKPNQTPRNAQLKIPSILFTVVLLGHRTRQFPDSETHSISINLGIDPSTTQP